MFPLKLNCSKNDIFEGERLLWGYFPRGFGFGPGCRTLAPYLKASQGAEGGKMIYKKQCAGLLVSSTIRPAFLLPSKLKKGTFQFY